MSNTESDGGNWATEEGWPGATTEDQQGYAAQQDYGTAQQGYGTQQDYGAAQQGYATQQDWGAQQGHDSPQGYDSQQDYGTAQQGYATQSDYGAAQRGYATQQDWGAQQGHDSPQGYDSQQPYGTQQDYATQQDQGQVPWGGGGAGGSVFAPETASSAALMDSFEGHASAAPATHQAVIDPPAPLHDIRDEISAAYDRVFEAQAKGLGTLKSTLEHIKPPTNVVAQLALAAVTIAISALLTPAAGMAVAGIEGEMAEVLKSGMEETIKAATDGAKEAIAQHQEEQEAESEAEAIQNFIDWQSDAISGAKYQAKIRLIHVTTQLTNAGDVVQGQKALNALRDSVMQQIPQAAQIQILHSAVTWARAKASEDDGGSSDGGPFLYPGGADVDNEEVKTGDLEIEATVDHSANLTVTGANWKDISRSLERLVHNQGSIPIRELGVRMRVYLEVHDPQNRVSKAQFEYTPAPEETEGAISIPIIVVPNDPAEQRSICNAVVGFEQVSDQELSSRAMQAASQLGLKIAAMPVSSLRFKS